METPSFQDEDVQEQPAVDDAPDGVSAATGATPLAIIKPGENPLWFELGIEGPLHIGDPSEAAQTPFTPWRLSRHVAGMALDERTLTMAVNREGLLVLIPQESGAGSLALYRAAESFWEDYTTAAIFVFRGIPTALLYRDDFFIDSDAALPEPRLWRWEKGSLHLLGIEIPAFAELSAAKSWDIEALSLGRDGRWYFRAMRKSRSPPEPVYFRAADLEQKGESISAGVFRNATVPYTNNGIPEVFRRILAEAGRGSAPVVSVVSPDFPALRYYAGASAGDALEVAGFYQSGADAGPLAVVVFPDGRLWYNTGSGTPGAYSLPALPEGFVYTRICLLGNVLIAAWEEQDSWNIGAAGFMLILMPGEVFTGKGRTKDGKE